MTDLFILICLLVSVYWIYRLVTIKDTEKPELPKQRTVYAKGKLNHRRMKKKL